ncbi:MAG TPA: hypothetical protein VFR86_06550, partial [Burkholderiaceae bacterium]|nr:hypothetical protein [Burkholderiaceae bacterium]
MKLATILRVSLALQFALGFLLVLWLRPDAPLLFALFAGLALPFIVTGFGLAIQVIVGAIV